MGDEKDDGILGMAVKEIFQKMVTMTKDEKYKVSISLIEIYNETIRDLLDDSNQRKSITLREDQAKGGYSSDALEINVLDFESTMTLFHKGNNHIFT